MYDQDAKKKRFTKLTCCHNLISVLYSYAFQLREDIAEVEETLFDTKNILLHFDEKIPDYNYFPIVICNIKITLEKINQIFIKNELKFKHWNKKDQLNLYELDFHLKQLKEILEKEYIDYDQMIFKFEQQHPDALDFWRKHFENKKFVTINEFLISIEKECEIFDLVLLETIKLYIDVNCDGFICIHKFFKFLNHFGNFKNFSSNINNMIEKKIFVFSISSHKANYKLKSCKKGSFLVRFSKTKSECFAISFINDKGEIKQFLINCLNGELKINNSERIYHNLLDFIQSHSTILRQSVEKENILTKIISAKKVDPSRSEPTLVCYSCKKKICDKK